MDMNLSSLKESLNQKNMLLTQIRKEADKVVNMCQEGYQKLENNKNRKSALDAEISLQREATSKVEGCLDGLKRESEDIILQCERLRTSIADELLDNKNSQKEFDNNVVNIANEMTGKMEMHGRKAIEAKIEELMEANKGTQSELADIKRHVDILVEKMEKVRNEPSPILFALDKYRQSESHSNGESKPNFPAIISTYEQELRLQKMKINLVQKELDRLEEAQSKLLNG